MKRVENLLTALVFKGPYFERQEIMHMMNTVKLAELLATDKLGSIIPFMSGAGAQGQLGTPEGFGKFRDANGNLGEIWKYESIQLSFIDDRLHQIVIDFQFPFLLPSVVVAEGYFPTSSTTFSEFREFLENVSLSCELDPALTFDSQKTLIIESRSRVIFDLPSKRIMEVHVNSAVPHRGDQSAALNTKH